jgi:hypothetical protein
MEVNETEKTKKKRKKVKEENTKSDMLDNTPKVVRHFSFANLHSCMSPLIFSSVKKEDRDEKVFQPCVLVQSS